MAENIFIRLKAVAGWAVFCGILAALSSCDERRVLIMRQEMKCYAAAKSASSGAERERAFWSCLEKTR